MFFPGLAEDDASSRVPRASHRFSGIVPIEPDRPWPDHQQDVGHRRSASGNLSGPKSHRQK